MKAPLIMIIRHGEKPTPELDGVDESGKNSAHDLIVRGWQRAGALVHVFAPLAGEPVRDKLARPTHVIAMCAAERAADEKDKSKREMETAGPIAEALGVEIDGRFGKGTEQQAAQAAMGQDGPVLIVWDHKEIVALTRAITDAPLPAEWPGDRFDIIFLLRLRNDGSGYDFEQVPELVLAGDLPSVLPV